MKSAPFHVKFTHSSAVVQQKVLASSAWAHFPCRGSDQFPRSMPGSKSRSHAKQLEALKKSDPEFLAFLQQNDPALLDFAGDADSDSDSGSAGGEEHTPGTGAGADDEEAAFEDDDSSSDDEPERVLGATIPKPGEGSDDEEEEGGDDASEGASGTLLDAAKLAELTDSAFAQRHLRGLQYMLHAFRAAVHQQDEAPPATLRFRITSDLVFSKVLAVVLTNARGAFAHHLQGAVASVGPFNASQLTRSKRFRKVSPLLQSFLANLAHLLGQTLDASLLLLVLRSLKLYLPFFGAFPKLAARVTKALLRLYSREYPPAVHMEGEASHLAVAGVPLASAAASKGGGRGTKRGRAGQDASADLQSALASAPATDGGVTVRALTFLRLRQCAVELPYPILDTVIKGVYLAYVRLSKKFAGAEGRLPMARLMAAAVVEVASLDMAAAYQHGFVYMRQLALHLRAALTAKSPAAVTTVLSWPFLAALRAWTAVMVAHGSSDSSPLWQLVYPLAQLCLGVLQLTRTIHRYYYLRLHVLACLTELSLRCGVYLPLGTHLLDVVQAPHFVSGSGKAPKASGGGKPPAFSTTLRLADGALSHKAVLDHTVTTTFALLSRWLLGQGDSVAYPEVTTPLVVRLKKWVKAARTSAWKAAGRNTLKHINARSKTVLALRAAAAGLKPSAMADIAAFQTRSLTKAATSAVREAGPAAADAVLSALWVVERPAGEGAGAGEEGLDALGVAALATAGASQASADLQAALEGRGVPGSHKRRKVGFAAEVREGGAAGEEVGTPVAVPDMADTVTTFDLDGSGSEEDA